MLKSDDTRRAVYRRGSVPGQVDHPGWLSKVVEHDAELEQALVDGWQIDMREVAVVVPDARELAQEPAPEFHHEPPRDWIEPTTAKPRGRKGRA